jgi:lipopolysaccharide transport system ATP-binding protein
MSSEVAIRIRDVGKRYPVFSRPSDRLKQMVLPRLRRAFGRDAKPYFREFAALEGVSCDIHRGEQVGILGRNGAGKSTLLQIVCGTLSPSDGSVEVNGRVAALLELGAGFNPEFSGRENVQLNSALLGMSAAEIDHSMDAILAFADIGEFIDRPVKTYSSGMYMRLGFSVAIHASPEILIVDEALAVGDEAFQRKCLARVARLRDDGGTILFVSHSASMVVETCDRAMLLDGGRLVKIGPAKPVVAAYQKLLYAPAERQAAVRAALMADDDAVAAESVVPVLAADLASTVEVDDADDALDFFDPALAAAGGVRYENLGVEILSPRLQTRDGRAVNVLEHGRHYVYAYDVRVDRSVVGVRFGMMVRSMGGVEIGGCATAAEGQGIPHLSPGERFAVRFEFRCDLMPGAYFLNAGVVGIENVAETYLDRCIDAVAIRVIARAPSRATGYVDLGIHPEVTRV